MCREGGAEWVDVLDLIVCLFTHARTFIIVFEI